MALDLFHPAVSNWFTKQFPAPTEPQIKAWPSIKERRHTLIAAPTGSGKTLSAFLAAIDDLVRLGVENRLDNTTHVVYVSPLKALSNDIQRNLQQPLEGIQRELTAMGIPEVRIRTLVRTGDTPQSERVAMIKRPPHIIVTTPESLYILLTSEGGRRMLSTTKTLIVDEIHAMVSDKRGSHLALSMERLEALAGPLVRIGLSATQRPIEEVGRFLLGNREAPDSGSAPACTIIDTGHSRRLDLAIEIPRSPLEPVMSNEVWEEVYDRIAELILEHRTTLVFVNTRRLAERVARHLGERVGDENVTSHHGSLARERRLMAEQRLKAGELRALVATASLELGIDIGAVDLVCQLGSTRSIATLLQRVGRSGHTVQGFPKGRLFPQTRDDLVECGALLDSIRRSELDRLSIPRQPLDILAQQLVAAVSCGEWTEDELYAMARRAHPYRDLHRAEFDAVIKMLAEGFTTRRGRHNSYLHHDAVNRRLRGRRGARLTAITSGGAIPDTADYDVVLDPSETMVGNVNEDFAIESLAGDIFQLGNTSWRITRVETGRVRVEDAHGQPPTIPFWVGEAPGRTKELSAAVSRFRQEISDKLKENTDRSQPEDDAIEGGQATRWLVEDVGVTQAAAEQIVQYLGAGEIALGAMPTQQQIVFERFFDESGGTQLVIHSPFGSRLNRAWGLALRKRFCRKFNFELQAAATEDAIVLSLGATHSFPIEDVFGYLRSSSVRDLLIQALLDAPMFAVRWRWNASRALAVLRRRGGRKIPAQLQRLDAEDLLAVIFPDQLACAENLTGNREIPDHPLVSQTIRDCLEEAMDIEYLEEVLRMIERQGISLIARDLREPSPFAQEILSARPYAFLDDAPLEERRTRAVMSRRWTPESASDLGKLDPSAIDRVRDEAWPLIRDADELHDALVQLGFLTEEEARALKPGLASDETTDDGVPISTSLFSHLAEEKRAALLNPASDGRRLWVAAERLNQLLAVFPEAVTVPPIAVPEGSRDESWSPETALIELLRGRLEAVGPVTAHSIADSIGISLDHVEAGLTALESEGFVMRGRFTPDLGETEWCVRRLLARIHRYTLNRLRQEIEPVSPADFIRFLTTWQRLGADDQLDGQESLAMVLEQLEGFEAAAAAWEGEILPTRLPDYDPTWLDAVCASGRFVWMRISPPKGGTSGPVRSTPIVLLSRKNLPMWRQVFSQQRANGAQAPGLSHVARTVLECLDSIGASFFADLMEGTKLLRAQVEEGLAELVAAGLVTSDSFCGLRALLTPTNKRPSSANGRRRRSAPFSIEDAGRWSRLRPPDRPETTSREQVGGRRSPRQPSGYFNPVERETVENVARALLRRYGVVARRLIEREAFPIPWRDLLRAFRHLEARGDIRGGRFIAGLSGEQFALPEAVGALRGIRRAPGEGALLSVCASDPINLIGVATPGPRITNLPSNRVLYRDGVPIAIMEANEIRYLTDLEPAVEWQVRNALVRRSTPPALRSYLGRSA
jgi:ATP-dependent helicase Lhr and Lhr-like helicase